MRTRRKYYCTHATPRLLIWALVLASWLPAVATAQTGERPCWDVTLLLDLSDRIKADDHPARGDKDRAVISTAWEEFKVHAAKELLFIGACGRFRIFVMPQRSTPKLTRLAEPLYLDLRSQRLRNRERVESFDSSFAATIQSLYQTAEQANTYSGSDIWTFMNNHVRIDTEADNRSIRNMIIILNDGYMYADENRHRIGNRFTYNVDEAMAPFRDDPEWERKFEDKGYGFRPVGTDLHSADVLIMGLEPVSNFFNELNIMKKYWHDWFTKMGAGEVHIHASGPSSLEQEIVRDFLRGK